MDGADFLAGLESLRRTYDPLASGLGNVGSNDLRASSRCMFSTQLANCYRCTHCVDCRDSSQLAHCSRSEACHASSYLEDCSRCSGSAYLVACVGLTDSTYCLGCVGLHKRDFHILNQAYARADYFAILARLQRDLGDRLKGGHHGRSAGTA